MDWLVPRPLREAVKFVFIEGLRVPLKNEKFKNKFLLVHGVAI